jgi:hypothetical protein
VAGFVAGAAAQSVDVERPRTLVVGMPSGGARGDRVDPGRTGHTREALPSSGLRTEWRTSLGALIEHAPLVDARGVAYVVGSRGEVVAVARDGIERWQASTGAMQPGPPALLSNDTIVFVDVAGEAVAVREGTVRWRRHFGRSDAERPAPLAMADGGIVVATTHELAALDADGQERARTTLAEATTSPLIAAQGHVLVIGASGAVWSWFPGAREAKRIGSFGAPVADGAASADDHTLVAVSAGQTRLLALDIARGTAATRAVAPPAPTALWLGPPAMRGSTAYLLATASTSDLVVAIDGAGAEVLRVLTAAHPSAVAPDGGAAALVAPPHVPPLVDDAGTVAFATAGGGVGIASRRGTEVLGDTCPPSIAGARARPIAGLAPLGEGSFVVACASGTLVSVRGVTAPGGEEGAPHL